MKLDPQVFVRAAQRVDRGLNEFSCVAITHALLETHGSDLDASNRHRHFYRETVIGHMGLPWSCWDKSAKQERVLALLFAAAICEDANNEQGEPT